MTVDECIALTTAATVEGEEVIFVEPHVCPDCDQDCVGNHDGTHTCWGCGIQF